MKGIRDELSAFKGNRPLQFRNSGTACLTSMTLHYTEFEKPEDFIQRKLKIEGYDHTEIEDLQLSEYAESKIVNDRPAIFGCLGMEEKLTKLDFLNCYDGGLSPFVHERVLAKFNLLCPNDFQAIPMIIKSMNKKLPYYENRDYYIINTLHKASIINAEKSIVTHIGGGVHTFENTHVNEGLMDGHLIAREQLNENRLFFHPILAREFKQRSKGANFWVYPS